MSFTGFKPSLMKFLKQLEKNNNRDWFADNKQRYEDLVVEPVMDFIDAMRPRVETISPHFLALRGRTGGSMMRVYRDTRFSKDKTPYKTNVGLQFRHELGRDVHAPGFYVHLQSSGCFIGAGIWHPASDALGAIRRHIDENQPAWKKAKSARRFRKTFELSGESLKTVPRGFDPDHPAIEDLRRKDFMGIARVTQKEIGSADFVKQTTGTLRAAKPLMSFLCEALDVPF